jgi:sulfide dehydrogenase cytochrome subunit
MRRALGTLLVLVVMAASKQTDATQTDVRALAAGCASCHQPSERVPPPLAGQSRTALITKLRGFRDGSLPGTVMPVIATGYTPAELDALARHFADMPRAR